MFHPSFLALAAVCHWLLSVKNEGHLIWRSKYHFCCIMQHAQTPRRCHTTHKPRAHTHTHTHTHTMLKLAHTEAEEMPHTTPHKKRARKHTHTHTPREREKPSMGHKHRTTHLTPHTHTPYHTSHHTKTIELGCSQHILLCE